MSTDPAEFFGDVDDESGPILPPWYVVGWTAQNELTANIPAPPNPLLSTAFPSDQLFVLVTQFYFDPDSDPGGGYLTFWPSDNFTITENGVPYRITQRLAGTDTYPQTNAGVSPWAFSLEGSGKIFIFRGLLQAKLYATDNPNVVTDSGEPLTYHVTEHFKGGRQYDISVPGASIPPVYLSSLIIEGSIQPWQYSPVFPMGIPGLPSAPPVTPLSITQDALSTDEVSVTVSASQNPTADLVQLAFPVAGVKPVGGDWLDAVWVTDGLPYVAEVLVGPDAGTIDLAPGRYDIWVKITAPPSVPVFKAGTLVIT